MEKYTVNGHEVEFDTFDLANIALYQQETQRVSKLAEDAKASGADAISILKTQVYSITDFFDTMLGDGKSKEIFAGRINVKVIFDAYTTFVADVAEAMRNFTASLPAAGENAVNPDVLSFTIPEVTEAAAQDRAQRRAAALEAMTR